MPRTASTSTDGQPRTRRATPAPPPVSADLAPLIDPLIQAERETQTRLASVEEKLASLTTTLDQTVGTLASVAELVANAIPPAVAPAPAPRARRAPAHAGDNRLGVPVPEGKPETLKEAITVVLRGNRRRPMKADAIMDALEARGGHVPGGQTPEATISALLATEHTKGGAFERTSPGTYRLRASR